MQVVGADLSNPRVHYVAPAARLLEAEMSAFIEWVNGDDGSPAILRAALAHLWLVSIHPFEDGNGRIARAVTDWSLARAERANLRCYSMSAQIRLERNEYYRILELTQKDTMDVTDWLAWFLGCFERALEFGEKELAGVFRRDRFWKAHPGLFLNPRQKKVVDRLLEDFQGKLTSSKWSALNGDCSPDTSQRDIKDLVERGILRKEAAGGRSTSYALVEPAAP